jgi:hypothetical protein
LNVSGFHNQIQSFNMMLSPSAARMGCVSTKLLHTRETRRLFSVAAGRRSVLLRSGAPNYKTWHTRAALVSDVARWKSTLAPYSDSDDEDMFDRSYGHAEAAKVRSAFAREEAWMVNLGRDDNNEWLIGPRDPDEWFTGLKPSSCPGE